MRMGFARADESLRAGRTVSLLSRHTRPGTGAEYSQVGFGSLGWVVGGAGGVPAFFEPGMQPGLQQVWFGLVWFGLEGLPPVASVLLC